MNPYIQLCPVTQKFVFKVSILKRMMYCGSLWGLYYQGWAIRLDQDDYIFPFWMNYIQARYYAKQHWPNYIPRKITPADFEKSLLPTLTRLNVIPTLFHCNHNKLKFSTEYMQHFFFRHTSAFSRLNIFQSL